MTRSAEKVEHEVEKRRERLDRTLDELQSRLDVSGLRSRLTDLDWRSTSLNRTARGFLSSTRRNPIPVLMICAGVSWLLYETLNRKTFGRSLRSPVRSEAQGMGAKDPAQTSPAAKPAHGEAGLDEALKGTLTGSEPVAVQITG